MAYRCIHVALTRPLTFTLTYDLEFQPKASSWNGNKQTNKQTDDTDYFTVPADAVGNEYSNCTRIE